MAAFNLDIAGQLDKLNEDLSKLQPAEILQWSVESIANLYQTTAFGLTGLVILDMLSKLRIADGSIPQIDLIFIDTLFHFKETLDLIERVKVKYPGTTVRVFKPKDANTTAEFEEKFGCRLWESDCDRYDHKAKIEPAERAYAELSVAAVLTGRRRSQGGERTDLGPIEIDSGGLVKINPLFNWSFPQVQEYIVANNVPYNPLLDQGYKSVGDWHSTQPTEDGESERAGRWKGQEKTECGIHFRSRTTTAESVRV